MKVVVEFERPNAFLYSFVGIFSPKNIVLYVSIKKVKSQLMGEMHLPWMRKILPLEAAVYRIQSGL